MTPEVRQARYCACGRLYNFDPPSGFHYCEPCTGPFDSAEMQRVAAMIAEAKAIPKEQMIQVNLSDIFRFFAS